MSRRAVAATPRRRTDLLFGSPDTVFLPLSRPCPNKFLRRRVPDRTPIEVLHSGARSAASDGMEGISKRFVYVLRSASDPTRHYVGLTSDVAKRLVWHIRRLAR